MGEQCEFCWAKFKSSRYLEHHQHQAKYCQKYKYIIFTCRKCNYSTRGIKNIDSHIMKCKSTEKIINDPIVDLQKRIHELEEELNTYKSENSSLKNSLKNQEELSEFIRLERFKNKIYRHIIEQNTSIRMDDVLVEKSDGVHLYNIKGGSIPIFVHEHIKSEEGLMVTQPMIKQPILSKESPKKKSNKKCIIQETEQDNTKSKKESFRSIKTCLDLTKEKDESDIAVHIDLIDADIQDQMDSYDTIDEAEIIFNSIFDKLKQNRVYTKILEELRIQRYKIFGRLSLSQYQNLLLTQIRTIEDIFKEKNYASKKSTTIISKGLTSLESRLVGYGNYINMHLDIDEIYRLEEVLNLHSNSEKEYTPFNHHIICEQFFNYGAVIFPIKKNITRYMINRYGFNNIIYLPLPQNVKDDPYSFYTLSRVNKEKRYWKMDCRLEELCSNIITEILPYMISMFRKLYRDTFGDNEFRKNYISSSQITQCDCEQLLQNIILLGQPKEFCNTLRNLVKEKSTYSPTENDKFNLYGDDALQRKRFQEKEDGDLVEIIKQIFDGISSEEAVDFYRSRT